MNTDEEQLRLPHSSKENTGARKGGRKRDVKDMQTKDLSSLWLVNLTREGLGRGKEGFR